MENATGNVENVTGSEEKISQSPVGSARRSPGYCGGAKVAERTMDALVAAGCPEDVAEGIAVGRILSLREIWQRMSEFMRPASLPPYDVFHCHVTRRRPAPKRSSSPRRPRS